MNEDAKAAAEAIWNSLKPAIEALTEKATALYGAMGSTRHCRHINELWRPEHAAVGIGFVPPEAKDKLEGLIIGSGIHLHKGNGPLGRGVYFSLLHDGQLTSERLLKLADIIEKETLTFKDAPAPKPRPTIAFEAEEQVARVEGFSAVRGDKLRARPAEVATVVDAFNGASREMSPLQVIRYLKDAITYFDNVPDIARNELLRTLSVMEDVESKG
jgi:hypothetical protein